MFGMLMIVMAALQSDPRSVLPADWAGACEVPAKPLALADAVNLALCRNPRTAAAWAAAQAAAAQAGAARGPLLPQIDAQIGPTLNRSQSFRNTGFVDGNGQIIGGGETTTTNVTTTARLGLSWLVIDGGARAGRIAAADANARALQAQFDDSAQGVILEVVNAWNTLAANRAVEDANRANLAFARQSRALAAARKAAGVATGADALQGETQAAQAELTLIQTRGNVASAAGRLAVAMGLPPGTALMLEQLAPLDAASALKAGADTLINQAETLRPDLRAARAQLEAAAANERVAQSAGRPSVAFQATNSLSALDRSIDRNLSSAAINLNIPLFSGWSTRYQIAQTKAQRAQQSAVLEQVRQSAGLAVWQAYVGLDNALASLTPATALLRSASESANLAQGRYQAGTGTFADLLNAQNALASARQQSVQAEFGVRTAQAELARAVGDMSAYEGTKP